MINLSAIKNQNLRNLIKKSKRFQALSKDEQTSYIKRITGLPIKQQRKAMEFFIDENKKEKKTLKEATPSDNTLLTQFLKDLEELEQKYTKLARQDRENVDREKEAEQSKNLLNELSNT